MKIKIFLISIFTTIILNGFSQVLYLPSGLNGIGTSTNSNIGIGTNSPNAKLHIFSSSGCGLRMDAPDALIIKRTNWPGVCKFGISGAVGWSRGLRFTMAPNETSAYVDALYLESTGNVSIGDTDPAGASLKVFRTQLPVFEVSNSISKLQLGVVYSSWQLANESQPGDIVFRPISNNGHHGMIFYLPNNNSDGNSYFAFGDNANNLWMKINNDKTLRVNGTIYATKIYVKTDVWSDFVFENDYKLKSLEEIEIFIKNNKHLPDVPSANQVIEQGINIADMNVILLKKIEELTLLMIEQNKIIKDLQSKVNENQK